MSYQNTSSEMVTAFFDNQTEAHAAVDQLIAAGVDRDAVRMVAGNGGEQSTTTASGESKGFFEALGDFFMPDEDRHTYAEGLGRGGYLVSVSTTATNRDTVLDILDDEGSVNLDERAESWRSEGWTGYEAGATSAATTAATTGITGSGYTASNTSASALGTSSDLGTSSGLGASSGLETSSLGGVSDQAGTIEVVEENLRVGKRDVSHGRVRVRSYVVEEAVSADVDLRSERVDIVRRPVDRAVTGTDAVFRDQTLELEETAEEAVVAKEARVKEEIDLQRQVETTTETISDTVRHTEVEIEDERDGLTGQTRIGDVNRRD